MQRLTIIPANRIEQRILEIRGKRVIIDADLAAFYGVTTRRLNEQVRRNGKRFPVDFMFQLRADEKAEVVAYCDHLSKLKYSRTLPFAFTEHGAIMAANVLNSPRAVEMGVFVVRAFVKLRRTVESHEALAHKVAQLERQLGKQGEELTAIISTIKSLLSTKSVPKKRRIGFETEKP